MAAVIEDPIRSSVVVLQTLEVMKNEFRRELFNYFNLRMSGDNRASALSFFHMRRELSRILDAIVIRIQTLGPNYHLDNAFRTAIQQEILNVRTAWSTADVRVQADINYIEGLFNTRINNFLVGTYVRHEEDKGLCMVCLDTPVDIIFVECGHANVCQACYNIMFGNAHGYPVCPSCRADARTTEPLTNTQRRILLAGGSARHSRGRSIFLQADAKRSFCVMGDVHIAGLS